MQGVYELRCIVLYLQCIPQSTNLNNRVILQMGFKTSTLHVASPPPVSVISWSFYIDLIASTLYVTYKTDCISFLLLPTTSIFTAVYTCSTL